MTSYVAEIAKDVRTTLKDRKNTPGGFTLPAGARYRVNTETGSMHSHVNIVLADMPPAWTWQPGHGPSNDAVRRLTPEAQTLVNRVRWLGMRAARGRGTGGVMIEHGPHRVEVGTHWESKEYQASLAAERQPDPAPAPADDDSRECAKCGDTVLTLSSDDKCDGCVAEEDQPASNLVSKAIAMRTDHHRKEADGDLYVALSDLAEVGRELEAGRVPNPARTAAALAAVGRLNAHVTALRTLAELTDNN
jgi:hypothetical protein